MELKESTKRNVFMAKVNTGPLLVPVIIGLVIWNMVISCGQQGPVDVQSEINQNFRVTFFARNFLLLWLAGSCTEQQLKTPEGCDQPTKLAAMSAISGTPVLNSSPLTVTDINTVKIDRTATQSGEPEWTLKLAATVIPPTSTGEGISTYRLYYQLNVLETDDTFKALIWPRPVGDKQRTVEIKPFYSVSIDPKSNLSKNVSDFLEAYYKPTGQKSVSQLLVTGNFKDQPLNGTPYAGVKMTSLMASKTSADPTQAKPGDVMHVLATANLVITQTTFLISNIPLRLVMAENKSWLVDGFEEPIDFGAVTYK
ncbi:Uncharacterised protein [Mycobacteroides abscessus subsp. abscessus]|nr:Uncharacterised protein [Mycobacteroides abscessus subsp. abscessus]